MDYLNVLCSSPHCNKLLSNNRDGSSPYSIIKCGHIYHGSCFENIKRDKFCPKCQVTFDPRQCCKINCNFLRTADDEGEEDSLNGDNKQNEFYQWMFYDDRTDVTAAEIKEFACPLGTDEKGQTVYAARAFYNDDILPAYFVPQDKLFFTISENEVRIVTEDVDILDIHNDKDQAVYEWVECNGAAIPDNAVVTGEMSTGDKLYTVRSEHLTRMSYGKLDAKMEEAQVICPFERSGKILYKVENKKKYEVLVRYAQTMHANQME